MKRCVVRKLLNHSHSTPWRAPDSFAGLPSLKLIMSRWAGREELDRTFTNFSQNASEGKMLETLRMLSKSKSEAGRSLHCCDSSKVCFYSRYPKDFFMFHSQASNLGGIIEVPLAQTGEGIADCELLTWLVKEGDEVDEFQPLCSVQSDKATIQITSRYKGRVSRLNFMPGDVVKVGESLLELVGGKSKHTEARQVSSHEQISDAEEDDLLSSHDPSAGHDDEVNKKVLATPAVRHFARQYGIKLEGVSGSGKDGRILREDLMKHIANKEGLNQELAAVSEIAPKPELAPQSNQDEELGHSKQIEPGAIPCDSKRMENLLPEDKIIHVRGYQRIMVKAMTAAAAIPHFHLVDDLDVGALVTLRSNLKDAFLEKGIKLTYMPFIIKALLVTLVRYPLVNSTCNEEASEICCRGAHNVGVAIATSHGLVVPNIKNVQNSSVLEIAKELSRLTELATTNQLSSADVSGGTITVSNFGSVGGKFGSPLLNLPEVAIVAIGRIQKIPRFSIDGSIYPASIMNVTWGADHRVLDGATVASVCNEWKTLVERPERLVMYLK